MAPIESERRKIIEFFFEKRTVFHRQILIFMKRWLLTLALLPVLCASCSTNYYNYSGSGIYHGRGGASKNVDGVDIWIDGSPPRKFKIIGYITDSRPGGPIPMAMRDSDLAAAAKRNGGDGILLKAEQSDFIGTASTANATAVTNGNVTTAFGSGVSVPIVRREGNIRSSSMSTKKITRLFRQYDNLVLWIRLAHRPSMDNGERE
jgi:hypothetical protein